MRERDRKEGWRGFLVRLINSTDMSEIITNHSTSETLWTHYRSAHTETCSVEF